MRWWWRGEDMRDEIVSEGWRMCDKVVILGERQVWMRWRWRWRWWGARVVVCGNIDLQQNLEREKQN